MIPIEDLTDVTLAIEDTDEDDEDDEDDEEDLTDVTVAQKVAHPPIFCSSSPRSQARCGPGLLYLAAL